MLINWIPPITLLWGRKNSLFLFHLDFHVPVWGAGGAQPNLPVSALFQPEITKKHRSFYRRGISVTPRKDYTHWSLLVSSIGTLHSPSQHHETPAARLKRSPDLSKTWIRLINLRQVLSWWWIKVQSEYFLLLEFVIKSPEFPKWTDSS